MTTRVHHLDCGPMRPLGGARLGLPSPMPAHCLLVERAEGLLLVDTGFGAGDVVDPGRLGRPFLALTRPELALETTAHARIRALGLDPADVTDVAVTHLDLDHAGGLGDLPQARVHVHAAELAAARAPRLAERSRYVAAQWSHGPRWETHDGGDVWRGFEGVTALGDDVVLVPLAGHTRGHTAIGVRRADGHWLLHAGDAYFHRSEVRDGPPMPRALRLFERSVAAVNPLRLANQERLRALVAEHPDDLTVFCAHDPVELAALAGPPLSPPR